MNPRRSFLGLGLASLGATVFSRAATASTLPTPIAFSPLPPTAKSRPARPSVASGSRDLLADLPRLDRCRVVAVHPLLVGALPVVLEGPEGRFQVDICRRAESACGVAQSLSLDLFVHNGGDGNKATTREQILAIRALAAEL